MSLRTTFLAHAIIIFLSTGVFRAAAHAEAPASFVGSAACVSCHAKEDGEWQGSFHQQAMAEASSTTVLGKFDHATFTYNGVVSTFYRRGEGFFVRTDGPDGRLHDYKIAYTFGVFPLQQYLIKFPDGKMQALGIAWDSRLAKDGGQRWFHLYPNERVDSKDVLHWTKHSQNWNFMCAECHSTNLQKSYDADKKSYHTTWSEINVGCEGCHGPASLHMTWAEKKESERNPAQTGFSFSFKSTPFVPIYDPKDSKTLPQPQRPQSIELDACGRCHARRSVISPEYVYGQPLMVTHFPSLLSAGLYHADGQIDDEVYEYGAFTQSRMYHSGVRCSDCHNPHSLKLRAPGNEVCAQCHVAAKYDATQHHFHKPGTSAAECKSCHMAEKTYMQVDRRFDHSLRIPRPAFSAKVGAPDVCTSCHKDKSPAWAESEIQTRFGPPKADFHDYGEAFAQARLGDQASATKLIAILSDSARPAIVRATAAQELAPYLTAESVSVLEWAISDKSAEVRAAVVGALESTPVEIKLKLVTTLLNDPVLGVRIEAAKVMASVPHAKFPQEGLQSMERASAEYLQSQFVNAESPQAQTNVGTFYAAKGKAREAEKAYRLAIQLESNFVPAYVNLADLLRQMGRDNEGRIVLQEAIQCVPNNAETHFALGLLEVRLGEKKQALKELKSAVRLQPDNPRFAYVHIVALLDLGKKNEARKAIAIAKGRFPNSAQWVALEAAAVSQVE